MSDQDTATLMTCCLARQVHDDDVVGVGLGTPMALAAALLARRTHASEADVIVAGAVSPDADLATCLAGAQALAGRCAGFAHHLLTMEMAERRAMTMQFLRPAQVDGSGNVNTSRIMEGGRVAGRLPGGLATADVVRILPRIALYHTDHRTRSLPERVGYLTGAGGGDPARGTSGPVRLVTDRAVFAFGSDGARVESIHAGEDVDAVLAATGFVPDPAEARTTEPPSEAELAALEEIDGHALRELELRTTREAAGRRLAALRT